MGVFFFFFSSVDVNIHRVGMPAIVNGFTINTNTKFFFFFSKKRNTKGKSYWFSWERTISAHPARCWRVSENPSDAWRRAQWWFGHT